MFPLSTVQSINNLPKKNGALISCAGCACKLRVTREGSGGLSIEIENPAFVSKPPEEMPLNISECYRIFGISPEMSDAEMRKAHIGKIKQYHPDKVEHLGPELKEVAERMSKRMNAAWDMISLKKAA
jgi:DnaJ-domain-containing protein 1